MEIINFNMQDFEKLKNSEARKKFSEIINIYCHNLKPWKVFERDFELKRISGLLAVTQESIKELYTKNLKITLENQALENQEENKKKYNNIPAPCLTLLKSPSLFDDFIKELDKKIVGEKDSRKVIVLCSYGGRLVQNAQVASFNLLINDEAGTGKDYITGKSLECLPKENYIKKTRISPTVFTYWHNSEYEPGWTWDNKVFYCEDISEPVLNSDVFKVMCSSGSSATITVKNKAVDININGKPVIITTTATAIPNPELTRRFVILNLDSSMNQTEAIMKRHSEFKMKGIIPEYDLKYKRAFEFLKPVKVIIPFCDLIHSHFPKENVLLRTHYPRFLDFISASTAFHQFQRKTSPEGFLIAEGKDYDIARDCLIKITSNEKMIPLTIIQRKILDKFSKNPGLKNTVAELHSEHGFNFCSDRALCANLSILSNYGFLKTTMETINYRERVLYYLECYDSKNLQIPKYEELMKQKEASK